MWGCDRFWECGGDRFLGMWESDRLLGDVIAQAVTCQFAFTEYFQLT
jgi:hypothetical protein